MPSRHAWGERHPSDAERRVWLTRAASEPAAPPSRVVVSRSERAPAASASAYGRVCSINSRVSGSSRGVRLTMRMSCLSASICSQWTKAVLPTPLWATMATSCGGGAWRDRRLSRASVRTRICPSRPAKQGGMRPGPGVNGLGGLAALRRMPRSLDADSWSLVPNETFPAWGMSSPAGCAPHVRPARLRRSGGILRPAAHSVKNSEQAPLAVISNLTQPLFVSGGPSIVGEGCHVPQG